MVLDRLEISLRLKTAMATNRGEILVCFDDALLGFEPKALMMDGVYPVSLMVGKQAPAV